MTNKFANHFLDKLEKTCCPECEVNETCFVKLPRTECFLHSAKFAELLAVYADKVKPETVADIQFQYQLNELKELQPIIEAIVELTPEQHDSGVSQDELISIQLERQKETAFYIERFKDDFKQTYETKVCLNCFMKESCAHSQNKDDRNGCIRFKDDQGEALLIADFKLFDGVLIWVRSMQK